MLPWREQVRRIAVDRESGASQIARDCAHALLAYLEQEQPDSSSRFDADLWEMTREILTGQPSMAPVLGVLNRALLLIDTALDPATIRQRLRAYAQGYLSERRQVARLISETALHIFPREGTVLTLSHSAAVANALTYAAEQGCRLRVICLESRPNYEGRTLATRLSDQGLAVSLMVDAAAYDGLLHSDLFVAGADSLTEQGVMNKTGTALVAVTAHTLKIPAYVIADQEKVWPARLGIPSIADQPHSEVWEAAPAVVSVENRYFDLTPWTYWSGVVTERDLLEGRALTELCRSVQVDQRLEFHFV